MVPDGMNTAACLPSRSATRSHNRLVVGSSPICSSPTSARAIASRMPAGGRGGGVGSGSDAPRGGGGGGGAGGGGVGQREKPAAVLGGGARSARGSGSPGGPRRSPGLRHSNKK